MSNCAVCSEAVALTSMGDVVRCDGACMMYTHQKCAGIPKSVIKIVNETPNLRYFCPKCMSNDQEIRVSLSDIKDAISSVSERLDKVVVNVAAAPPTPFQLEFPELLRNSKRRRTDIPSVSEPPPTAVSPRAPPRRNLLVGSTVCDDVKTIEQRKSVVASMIHPSTEPSHLQSFLLKQLNLPADSTLIRCSLLLPKGKTAAEFNWVSFRVSAPESSFMSLQKAELWPKGVVVREFVQRPRAAQPLGAFLPTASQTEA